MRQRLLLLLVVVAILVPGVCLGGLTALLPVFACLLFGGRFICRYLVISRRVGLICCWLFATRLRSWGVRLVFAFGEDFLLLAARAEVIVVVDGVLLHFFELLLVAGRRLLSVLGGIDAAFEMVPSRAHIALDPSLAVPVLDRTLIRLRIHLKAVLAVLLIVEVFQTLFAKEFHLLVVQFHLHELAALIRTQIIEASLLGLARWRSLLLLTSFRLRLRLRKLFSDVVKQVRAQRFRRALTPLDPPVGQVLQVQEPLLVVLLGGLGN